jgi:predicted house-cleaning NTP pyrophosphatase (Maf/HAM1 superfamily)
MLQLPEDYELILGSSSKSRASILDKEGIKYSVQVAAIDEKGIGSREMGADPSELVMQLV